MRVAVNGIDLPGARRVDGESTDRVGREWRLVADSVPQLICLLGPDGKLLRVNRTLERWGLGGVHGVHGLSLHQALHGVCGDPDCVLLHLEKDILAEISEGRGISREVFDPVLGRHVELRGQPLGDTDGRSADGGGILAVVSVEDITTWKKSEQHRDFVRNDLEDRIFSEMAKRLELEDVRVRMSTILDRTPNFVAMADTTGGLLYLNPAGRLMLGIDAGADISGLAFADLLAAEEREKLFREDLPAAIRQGVWRGQSTLLTTDGRQIPATQVLIPQTDADGRNLGFSVVEHDMTAWVESEEVLRHSREELRELSVQLIDIREVERQRIAGDLHDGIGQSLSLIKLTIEDISHQLQIGSVLAAGESLQQLVLRVKDALAEVRRIAMDLRPSTLDDLGILATLSWFFREFAASCREIAVDRDFSIVEADVPAALKITIFRILQESVNNIVKHAAASRIRVSLSRRDDALIFVVEDNGRGFDASGGPGLGLGLRSMRERARASGGTYLLESVPGQGTRIQVSWPAAS